MYRVYIRNAIVLQIIASMLYFILSLTLSRQELAQTMALDLGFGITIFLVSGLLALWGFNRYR